MVRVVRFFLPLMVVGSLAIGCNSLLGDFTVSDNTGDASTGDAATDATTDAGSADGGTQIDSGDTRDAEAGTVDAPHEACSPETDTALCTRERKNCGGIVTTDACGVQRTIQSCGTCALPQTCNAQNLCACAAETDPQFCARLGKNCGTVQNLDNCGVSRTVANCGTCVSPQICSATVANVCGNTVCQPETDAQFCSRYGKNCNAFTAVDNCNVNRTVNCGMCASPQTCGALAQNVCGCSAESDATFCARMGLVCGVGQGTDNCGAARSVASCGQCTGTTNACLSGRCTCNGNTACTAGKSCCGNGCTDIASDPGNCGGCGRPCGPGGAWTCGSSVCHCDQRAAGDPAAGSDLCSDGRTCVAVHNTTNCAKCGNACNTGAGEDCISCIPPQSPNYFCGIPNAQCQ